MYVYNILYIYIGGMVCRTGSDRCRTAIGPGPVRTGDRTAVLVRFCQDRGPGPGPAQMKDRFAGPGPGPGKFRQKTGLDRTLQH